MNKKIKDYNEWEKDYLNKSIQKQKEKRKQLKNIIINGPQNKEEEEILKNGDYFFIERACEYPKVPQHTFKVLLKADYC